MLDLNELRKVAQVIYLIADEPVADDISGKIKAAVKEIEDLREFVKYILNHHSTYPKDFYDQKDQLLINLESYGTRED